LPPYKSRSVESRPGTRGALERPVSPDQPEGEADEEEGVQAMQAADEGSARKTDVGEDELEDDEEEKQGGETGGFPGVAGGEGEQDEDKDGERNDEGAIDAMEARKGDIGIEPGGVDSGGVIGRVCVGVTGGASDGENGGSDEVKLGEEFEEKKEAQGRICLREETGAARGGDCG
jgi:hypothetical protein